MLLGGALLGLDPGKDRSRGLITSEVNDYNVAVFLLCLLMLIILSFCFVHVY